MQLKNENKGDEMVEILDVLHQYVPLIADSRQKILSTGEVTTVEKACMHRVVVGGDQLTAARIRSAKKSKLNSNSPRKRLEGIISAAEDWHTKANFLGVSSIILVSFEGFAFTDSPSSLVIKTLVNHVQVIVFDFT